VKSSPSCSSSVPVRQGVLCVAIAATAWGTGGAAAAELYRVGGLGPISVSFWRFLAGFVLLLAAHLVRRFRRRGTAASLRASLAANKRLTLITGFGLAVYQTAYFAAVQQAGITVATVVTLGSGPVLVAIGARFMLDERVGAAGAASVASGVVGLVLLMRSTGGAAGPDPRLGIGYALLSAAGYAAVTLLRRMSGRKRAGGEFEATVAGFAVGTVCLLPIALLAGLLPGRGHVAWTVGLIVYLGTVPTALAYALFFVGLSVLRATTASVVALVEPLTAAVIGIAAFGERLDAVGVTGTAILLASVLVLAVDEAIGRQRSRSVPEVESGNGEPTESHTALRVED
jgi:drug/metabolite transporter, DME family